MTRNTTHHNGHTHTSSGHVCITKERDDQREKEGYTAVTVWLHPLEYGLFSAAAKTLGCATAAVALQEWLADGREVIDWQNNGFQMA